MIKKRGGQMPPFFLGFQGGGSPWQGTNLKKLVYLAIPIFGNILQSFRNLGAKMAHLAKYTRGCVHGILSHNQRDKDENKQYKNIDIDKSKTHLNYSYFDNKNAEERLNNRLKDLDVSKRSDVNILASWVVTLPKEVKEKDQKKFFNSVNNYLTKTYGKDNVISSDIHYDETTPHLHFTFIPVVENKKKNAKKSLKVSAKELLNRAHLQKFHDNLDRYVSADLGYASGILNGATTQNKSINELKKEFEKDCEKLNKIVNEKPKVKTNIFGKVVLSPDDYDKLANKADELKNATNDYINSRNGIKLKETLSQNNYLKNRNTELEKIAKNAQIEMENTKKECAEKIKRSEHQADLIHNINVKLRNENATLKDKCERLTRAVNSVWHSISDEMKEFLAVVGIGRGRGGRGR